MRFLLISYVIILAVFLVWAVVISTRQEGFLFRRRSPPYFLPPPPTNSDMFESSINRSMKYGRGPSEYGRKTRKRAGF